MKAYSLLATLKWSPQILIKLSLNFNSPLDAIVCPFQNMPKSNRYIPPVIRDWNIHFISRYSVCFHSNTAGFFGYHQSH